MARPSPRPPNRRVIELCPCSNALKTFPSLVRFDADAGVGDSDFDLVRRRIEGFNDDPAVLRGKFDAVLDQVPKDLLQARRIALDVRLLGPQTKFDLEIFRDDFLAADFVGALQDLVHAHGLES